MSFYDYPEGMKYLLEKCYEEQLEWAKAFAEAGAHSFIISESYISPDLANPEIYRNFMKPGPCPVFPGNKKLWAYPDLHVLGRCPATFG